MTKGNVGVSYRSLRPRCAETDGNPHSDSVRAGVGTLWRETRPDGKRGCPFSLESSGTSAHDSSLRFDNWEMSVKGQ